MQAQCVRGIVFPSSYESFRKRCLRAFASELALHGKAFKIYRVPAVISASFSDREKIDDEESYQQLYDEMCSKSGPFPNVYLWSVGNNEENPTQRSYEDYSGARSADSRGGTSVSGHVKELNEFHCLACAYDCQHSQSTLDGCHILELEELKVDDKQATALLEKCGIVSHDDPRNLIPLCKTCHNHFDFQRLGIELLTNSTYQWLVKPVLEDTRIPYNERPYKDLRGTKIVFARRGLRPPADLIAHRLDRYTHNIISRDNKKRKVREFE
jgi:hypothetical protein